MCFHLCAFHFFLFLLITNTDYRKLKGILAFARNYTQNLPYLRIRLALVRACSQHDGFDTSNSGTLWLYLDDAKVAYRPRGLEDLIPKSSLPTTLYLQLAQQKPYFKKLHLCPDMLSATINPFVENFSLGKVFLVFHMGCENNTCTNGFKNFGSS